MTPHPPIGSVPPPSMPYQSTRDEGRYSLRLLFTRWRGSVYKLVWRDLVVWLVIYYALNLSYRFAMNSEQRTKFEEISRLCDKYNDLIPLTFVLGLYVNLVIGRWWHMWAQLPWPDNLAFIVSSTFPGKDENSRMTRRTIMRYVILGSVYAKCLLSPRVRRRFPSLDHFVDAGLMTKHEQTIMEGLMEKNRKLYYVPLLWAAMIVTKARDEGRITDYHWNYCMTLITEFRTRLSHSLHIELVNVPLVYSQVVALAVYTFSLSCLMGRQFVKPEKGADDCDTYFPIFTVLQLVFYWGWLKVAEAMINPYGDDDADFDLNYYIDKNVKNSYMIVDEAMQAEFPDPVKDPYWDQVIPGDLPHTEESKEAEERIHHSRSAALDPDNPAYADVHPSAAALFRDLEAKLGQTKSKANDLRRRHTSVRAFLKRHEGGGASRLVTGDGSKEGGGWLLTHPLTPGPGGEGEHRAHQLASILEEGSFGSSSQAGNGGRDQFQRKASAPSLTTSSSDTVPSGPQATVAHPTVRL